MSSMEHFETVINGEAVELRRCPDCWRSQAYPHPGGRPIASGNGFIPVDRRYPHAKWCKNRGDQ